MRKFAPLLVGSILWLFLASMSAADSVRATTPSEPVQQIVEAPATPEPPPPPPPVMVSDLMSDGVLIIISKASQQMFVFKDGAFWGSSRVSTGKRGKATPSGVFAILQKKKFHRSNIYSNAPMPWMQRLTWSGIAIHAGHVPNYPASHGCIRLPKTFAKKLYSLTQFSSTAVIVTKDAIANNADALHLAGLNQAEVPMHERFREERAIRLASPTYRVPQHPTEIPTASSIGSVEQTIQLVAASSRSEAAAHWARLIRIRPELAQMQQAIVPAIVNSRQYYRLRATAPNANAVCSDLKRAGIDCFAVS